MASQDRLLRMLQGTADLSQPPFQTCLPPCRPGPTAPAPRSTPGSIGPSDQGSEAVASPADLPEHVILAMLRREDLLVDVMVNVLYYDEAEGLRKLNNELRQVGSLG